MSDRTDTQARARLKELTALLADHAEETMDSDDVDQVRAEVIALYDALAARLSEAERALRAVELAGGREGDE